MSFKLECKSLPLDHAWALSSALIATAPWLIEDKYTAIHLIHGAESANGWMRPDNPENEVLHLSRRARFTLRIHRDQLDKATELINTKLDINGHSLILKTYKQQLLVPQTTIFSRYVETPETLNEDDFLNEIAPEIEALGINIKKMMGGRQHSLHTPKSLITTRSLMLSDLSKEEAIALQQQGLGNKKLLGIGIFLPHKGIAAVKELNEELPPTQFG